MYKVKGYSSKENLWEYLNQIGTNKTSSDNYKTAMMSINKLQQKFSYEVSTKTDIKEPEVKVSQ